MHEDAEQETFGYYGSKCHYDLPRMGSRYDSRHYGRNDIGNDGLNRLRIGRRTGRYSTWGTTGYLAFDSSRTDGDRSNFYDRYGTDDKDCKRYYGL